MGQQVYISSTDMATIRKALNHGYTERMGYADAVSNCGMDDVRNKALQAATDMRALHLKWFGCEVAEVQIAQELDALPLVRIQDLGKREA